MIIYVTAVHMTAIDGRLHEHVDSVRWVNEDTGEGATSTRAQMVEWVLGGGDCRVRDGRSWVQVAVVQTQPPYLRTYADGRLTDNLLALPRF